MILAGFSIASLSDFRVKDLEMDASLITSMKTRHKSRRNLCFGKYGGWGANHGKRLIIQEGKIPFLFSREKCYVEIFRSCDGIVRVRAGVFIVLPWAYRSLHNP
jgi:hypothetical protein